MGTTIYNTGTSAVIDITLIDPKTGCDWSADFIGNTSHGMSRTAPDGVDVEADYYADKDACDWWERVADATQDAAWRLYEARKECDDEQHEELEALLCDSGHVDLEDVPKMINQAIDDVLGEDFEA